MVSPRIALLVRLLMRAGTVISTLLLAVGVASLLAQPTLAPPTLGVLLHALSPYSLLFAGLALLAITPVACVLLIAAGCLVTRDYRLALAAGVLLILVAVAAVWG